MADSLGSLVVRIAADTAQMQTGLAQIAREAESRAKQIDRAFGIVSTSLKAIGAGAAVGLSLESVRSKIDGAIASAAGLQQLAERTQSSVEALSAFTATAKLSNTDSEQLATGLQKLAKAMNEAQAKGGPTAEAFAAIGISTKELAGQRPDEVFLKIAQRLVQYQDGAEKAAVAQALFGKSGANLLPVLKDLAETSDLQVKVTAEQARQADDYERTLKRLDAANAAIAKRVAFEALPVMNAFAKAMLDQIRGAGGLKEAVDDLANDGSLRNWAEDAAKAVGFVVDAFDGVVRVARLAGMAIGAAAAVAVSHSLEGTKAILASFKEDADRILMAPQFSDRLSAQLAVARAKQPGPEKPRQKLAPIGSFGGGADTAKALFDQQLREQEKAIQSEQQLLQQREQMLQRFYGDDKLSITDYYGARRAAIEEGLRETLAAYDKEEAAARQYIASSKDAKSRIEAQTALQTVLDKRKQAVATAGFALLGATLDEAKATEKYRDDVEALNAKLLELQGNLVAAFDIQSRLQDKQQRQRLTTAGDNGALATLNQLEALQRAQVQINQLTQQSSLIEQQAGVVEGKINLARSTGAITTLQQMAQIDAARQAEVARLQSVADEMDRVARASGDPRMVANAEAFRLKLGELEASAHSLAKTFDDVFESSFSSAFADFISGTKSMSQAFRSFEQSVLQSISRIIAQNLAESLFGAKGGGIFSGVGQWFAGLFGGGKAVGGSVWPNTAYLVGERGPELFVPRSAGTIVPNGAGGRAIHVTQQIYVQGSVSNETANQIAAAAARRLRLAEARAF